MTNEDIKKEYLIDSLRYSLGLPLWAIFLVLLWQWNYRIPFWIFLGLVILEYITTTIKMTKLKKKFFK